MGKTRKQVIKVWGRDHLYKSDSGDQKTATDLNLPILTVIIAKIETATTMTMRLDAEPSLSSHQHSVIQINDIW